MVLLLLGSLLPRVLVSLKRIRQQIKLKLSTERVLVFRSPSGAERVSIQVVQYDVAFQSFTKFPSILSCNEMSVAYASVVPLVPQLPTVWHA